MLLEDSGERKRRDLARPDDAVFPVGVPGSGEVSVKAIKKRLIKAMVRERPRFTGYGHLEVDITRALAVENSLNAGARVDVYSLPPTMVKKQVLENRQGS